MYMKVLISIDVMYYRIAVFENSQTKYFDKLINDYK